MTAPAGEDPARESGSDRRHRGREAALQMLYLWEVGRTDLDQVMGSFWHIEQDDGEPGERAQAFAAGLARGTVAALEQIDRLIAESAEHWRIERMAVLDRLILRLGVYELLTGDTPPTVVINEAIELARTFSTEDAVRFINGLLDGVRKKLDESGKPT